MKTKKKKPVETITEIAKNAIVPEDIESAKYITITRACEIVKERGFNLSRVTVRNLIKKHKMHVQFRDWTKIFVDREKFLAFLDSYRRSES